MEKNYKAKYNEFLEAVEMRLKEIPAAKKPNSLYLPFEYLVTGGGKRIRPVLVMMCAAAVGANPEEAIDSAVAVEILHNFTLVHDDIMDKSPVRRNRPTVHVKWDEATAILAGDVMVGYSFALLPSPNHHEKSGAINAALAKGLIEVCEGQALDMEFNNRNDVSLDEYLLMINKKTAQLLIAAATIGGHFGKASTSKISSLEKFAYNLGIGFQIQDDLLDLTAEQIKLGKTIGQDIVEGKKTFLMIKAKELATKPEDFELLDKFFLNNGLPAEFVPSIQKMFARLGVIELASEEADKYYAKSKSELEKLSPGFYRDMLKWLVDSLNKREK